MKKLVLMRETEVYPDSVRVRFYVLDDFFVYDKEGVSLFSKEWYETKVRLNERVAKAIADKYSSVEDKEIIELFGEPKLSAPPEHSTCPGLMAKKSKKAIKRVTREVARWWYEGLARVKALHEQRGLDEWLIERGEVGPHGEVHKGGE